MRRRCRQGSLRRRALVNHNPARTRTRPIPSGRENSTKCGRARRTRMPQHRQANRRSRVRYQRRRHLLRILRRPGHKNSRLRKPCARQRRQSHAQRTNRSRRTDHPLELSVVDGGMETGAGARRRLHLRVETGRANAADSTGNGELVLRNWLAPRCCQHRYRIRRELWRAASEAPGCK